MALVEAPTAVEPTAPTGREVTSRRARRIALVPALSVAVLLGVLALIGLRATAPSDATVVLPSADLPGSTLRISTVLDSASGLRAGDVVVAIDGVPVDAVAPIGPRTGEAFIYTVRRDGAELDVPVRLGRWPLRDWLERNWPTGLLAGALLLTACHVYRRRPRDPAARALLMTAALASAGQASFVLGAQVVDLAARPALPAYAAGEAMLSASLLAWLIFVLMFPRPARRRRVIGVCAMCVVVGGGVLLGSALLADNATIARWRGMAVSVPFAWLVPAVLVTVLAVRLHAARGTPAARYLSWLLAAFATGSALFLALWTAPAEIRGEPLVPWEFVALAFLPCPAAFGAAVLRFGLFDVKAIAGRSLGYALLTVALAATYIGVVAGLGSLAVPGPGFAAPLVATVLLAVLFRPVKDRLQHAISRLLYGNRDEPYVVLSHLGQRLEQTSETAGVLSSIAETVAGALRLPYVGVELIGSDGTVLREATVGAATGEVIVLPAVVGDELVGRLRLTPRPPATDVEGSERTLLHDLARQAAPALQALRLTAELQRSRERLVLARAEERRRLQGDLHDGVGPTLAALLVQMEEARTLLDREETDSVAARLDVVEEQVRQCATDVRKLLVQLSSPLLDSIGLPGALEYQARRLESDTGPQIAVEIPDPLPKLPAAVEEAVLAVAAEAMSNAVRHSGAGRLRLSLAVSDEVRLCVSDDGSGRVTSRPGGPSLAGMRRRAEELGGTFTVGTPPGGGASVLMILPLRSS